MGNRRKQKNHFDWQVERNGENFIDNQTPNNLRDFHVPKIILDIARSNIDYREEERFFRNPALLNAIITVASEKYRTSGISATGVQMLLDGLKVNNPSDQRISEVATVHNIHLKTATLYKLVYEAFSSYRDFQDIDQLYPLSNQIRGYSDYI